MILSDHIEVALGLQRKHQHHQYDQRESSVAWDEGVNIVGFIEKSFAPKNGLYLPKCPISSLFGKCELADFEVAHGTVLGSGGYGKVYLGKHRPTGMAVALKQIQREKFNPRHVEHEETIHHSLSHPYISKFHCTMRDDAGNLFFAIEYIPGKNLGRRLGGRHGVTRATVQKYVAEIVTALEYLHAKCIVYRDLKASNILVSPKDHIKLIDFGLSIYDCDDQLRGFAGTLEYAAPEMAAHQNYGRAVDYYSLGILLFRLVTGRLPISRGDYNMDKREFLDFVARGFHFPSTGDKIADDLIGHFCDRNIATRYGLNPATHKHIRNHPFFHGFNWNTLAKASFQEDVMVSFDQLGLGESEMITLDKLAGFDTDFDNSY